MFQTRLIFKWLLAILFAGVLLLMIPFSQRELATQRLEQEIGRSVEIQKNIISVCRELIPNENTPLERWFINKIFTGPQTANTANLTSCVLRAKSTHSLRFYILAQWSLGFEVFKISSGASVLKQTFSTEFPLPLSFLPLLTFLIILPFGLSAKSSIVLLLFHFLFLSGINLIQFLKILPKTTINIVTTDRLFMGLLLLSFWLALRSLTERQQARTPSNPIESLVNSFISNGLGIWNPLFYTLLGPMIFSLGHKLKNLTVFFNAQLLILTLSLYIFGLDLSNIYSVFTTFLTPRYFSFAIIFYFFTTLIPSFPSHQPLIWEFKYFWRYFSTIFILEVAGFFIPDFRSIPTLTRIGLAFLLVEFTRFKLDSWIAIFQRWKGPLLALIISCFTATLSSDLGILDLIISICDPRKHPTAVLPFNLLSGFLLSFVTGGLASPFFILVSQMIQTYPNPLIRAALFDGVLAGLMLSPFSLFNLYPAFQHKIPIQQIIQLRARQLFIPLIMGIVVYFVGTVTTLGILPPVCFVFCCLTVITFKLKKSHWKTLSSS